LLKTLKLLGFYSALSTQHFAVTLIKGIDDIANCEAPIPG